MKLFLTIHFSLFVLSKIIFRVILGYSRMVVSLFLECCHWTLPRKRSWFFSGGFIVWYATLGSFPIFGLNPVQKKIWPLFKKLSDCIFFLQVPKRYKSSKLINKNGFLVCKNFTFDVDNIIFWKVQAAILAKVDNIRSRRTITIWLPEIKDRYLSRIYKLCDLWHH